MRISLLACAIAALTTWKGSAVGSTAGWAQGSRGSRTSCDSSSGRDMPAGTSWSRTSCWTRCPSTRQGTSSGAWTSSAAMSEQTFDVIAMGRVGVDLYPEQIGASLAEVRTFAKSLGGSPTNVAVGAARLGHTAAVITKVGDDGFGAYVRQALRD